SEINVIDICTPPYTHADFIIKALEHGKNVICEKPLTGYFGKENDIAPIGKTVSKKKMYEELIKDIDNLKLTIENSDKLFMYAENFIYAPAIQRAAELISAKKSKILYMKGEESLKGSSSPVAGEWCKTGGGTFIRTGSHPLSAILWLKQKEAEARNEQIKLVNVIADMSQVTSSLNDYEHRHISAKPNDVEDCGTVILTFSDNSKAIIIATDTLLGGSKNYLQLYCNDIAINCNLTLSNLMETYLLDEEGMDNIQLSEMLPSKLGWNKPFVADETIRGYIGEMQDFAECVSFKRKPKSDFKLAYDTIKTIYAAYCSAEKGEKILL
ncbi:MAG: Gfo/Idh/MocA family oxidoreductase, partial [Candidatus Riflebacteria bacterium]|nr:Gfo/Idh/MocA family oxidoreductase [Candidatus Riflebacteria bacterium]